MARMTDAQLAKWGERYGLTVENVKALRRLINRYAQQQEHACNGDPHRFAVATDKNACSAAWSRDSDRTGKKLEEMALLLGFDRVDFGVGLYPALEKDGDTCIMVPE